MFLVLSVTWPLTKFLLPFRQIVVRVGRSTLAEVICGFSSMGEAKGLYVFAKLPPTKLPLMPKEIFFVCGVVAELLLKLSFALTP